MNDGVTRPQAAVRLETSNIGKQYMLSAQSVTFRQASSLDIPAMSEIRLAVRENVLSNPDRITRQMYEDYLELLGRGWVAEVEGEVVGFSYADKENSSIWALFISPSNEGQGLAKRLLGMATEWLFEQGKTHVFLSTGSDTRADRFYALQGWTRVRAEGGNTFYSLLASQFKREA